MPNSYITLYTPLSRTDLLDIFDYIASDNLDAAITQIEHIEASISNLKEFPYSGTIPPDAQLRIKGYRYLFVNHYTVFYKPNTTFKQITIYRVLSTCQDYINHLD
jgi:plasmid stabilization system protein ParE